MYQPELIHRLIELNSFSEPEIQEHRDTQTDLRAELPDNQITPNLNKRTRRYFPPEYKLRTLAEANACRHGETSCFFHPTKANQYAFLESSCANLPFYHLCYRLDCRELV